MVKRAPTLVVNKQKTLSYESVGLGFTGNLFLVGHADGIPLNTPIKVTSMRKAVEALNNDMRSPLLRGLLEAYYAGARDIWLVASAPMYEYREWGDFDRGYDYDYTYKERLQATYDMLEDWDLAHITVPIGARFNDYDTKVDFLTQFVIYCVRGFLKSGEIHLGMMGTEGPIDTDMVNMLASDARINDLAPPEPDMLNDYTRWPVARKFVSVFVGNVMHSIQEMPFSYIGSPVASAAGLATSLPMGISMMSKFIPGVERVVNFDRNQFNVETLCNAGLNPVSEDLIGARGNPFRVRAITDNTLSEFGSSFWSLTQLRMIALLNRDVRSIATRYIGSIDFAMLRFEVRSYLTRLVREGHIREYDFHISRDQFRRGQVDIDINVKPFFGVRDLEVNIEAGPYSSRRLA